MISAAPPGRLTTPSSVGRPRRPGPVQRPLSRCLPDLVGDQSAETRKECRGWAASSTNTGLVQAPSRRPPAFQRWIDQHKYGAPFDHRGEPAPWASRPKAPACAPEQARIRSGFFAAVGLEVCEDGPSEIGIRAGRRRRATGSFLLRSFARVAPTTVGVCKGTVSRP